MCPAMPAPPPTTHFCSGECDPDEYCRCCLRECDCRELAEDLGEPLRMPLRPTRAAPGSAEKQRVMRARVARNECPCHPLDAREGNPDA